jgi:hypothetical protein
MKISNSNFLLLNITILCEQDFLKNILCNRYLKRRIFQMTYKQLIDENMKRLSYYQKKAYRAISCSSPQSNPVIKTDDGAINIDSGNNRVVNITLPPEAIENLLKGLSNPADAISKLKLPAISNLLTSDNTKAYLGSVKPYADGLRLYFENLSKYLQQTGNLVKPNK